jgi:hypothetical protein
MKTIVPFLLLCALAAQGVVCERRFKPRTYKYPAPREILLLDGEWEYRFPETWRKPAESFPWVKVQTPYVGSTSYITMRVTHSYRRSFSMPALAGRRAIIHFECIPCVCEVTVNDRLVLVHAPGSIPFDVDVTDIVKEGENSVRLDVREPKDDEKFAKGGPWLCEATWTVGCLMGYLRPIYMELRPRVSVEDVVIVTRVEGGKRIEVRAEVTNATTQARQIVVEGKSGEFSLGCGEVSIPPGGETTVTLAKDWPDATLWTPDNPNLHFLDLTVKEGGRTIDARRERFGFREITWKDDKVFLNGIPFMLKRGVDCAAELPDDASVAEALARLKRRGLNGIRMTPPNAARWVDVADENGFFISLYQSSNKAKNYNDKSWKWWSEQNLKMVKAYRNNPSIVAWGIGGEMGYVYGLTADKNTNKSLVAKMQEGGLAVQALDPTRPWVCHGDNEVPMPGTTKGPATIRTWHYPNPPTLDGRCIPEGAWWYKRREKSWHSITDRLKPICFGEDLYHGYHDQFFGFSKWAGDSPWTFDGYIAAWHDSVWMLADGYYDGDLAGWTLWCTADVAPTNRLFDVAGQLLPDYLVSIREPFRNLRSGVPEKRTLTVYNKRFRDRRMRLVRETVGQCAPTPPQTWTFTVPAGGRHVMEVEVRGDCSDKPIAMRHRYTLSDADTGERLFEREWKYTAFPNAPFVWPDDVAVISNGVKDAAAAIASGRPIVVARTLSRSEGRALKSHVASGGKVMIVDAKVGGWLPIPLRALPQSFVFRRSESGLAGVTDDMLACWRPNALVGTNGYVKVADRTVHTLLDSGHKDGLTGLQAGWLWDGDGSWFLLQLPVLGEDRDAAADWVLARAMDEFRTGGPALGAKLALSEDDPLASVWRNDGILFEAPSSKLNAEVLGISLAGDGAKGRWEKAKSHAERGGTVFIHSVSAANAALLSEIGLGFKPLEESVYVTRLGQSGLMDGVSNDDLYFSREKLGNVKFIYENRGVSVPRQRRGALVNNELLSGALVGKGVVTEPGAFADVPYGKGRIVVSTVRWAEEARRYPKKTCYLLRAVLRNMGVNAAGVAPDSVENPYRLSKSVNRPLWADPKLKGAARAWFGGEDDMRYFPVNLCGWSRDSGNCCPVEDVPTDPLRYAGHSFLVSQRKFGDVEAPAAIVLEPGEKTRIEIWTQYPKAFHFLGALAQDAADGTEVLKVSYGYRDKSRYDVKVFAGDQVNGFSREGKVKSGRIGWKGYSNKQPAAVLYCWQIPVENPRYLASFIELENTGPVPIAIVAITAERCPPSS